MTTTFTSISATAAAKTSAFIRKAASDTGAFVTRNKRTVIITTTSIVAGAALIAGAGIFVVNGINNGISIKPAAVSTSTPKATPAAPVDEDAQKAADAEKATAGKKVGDELTAAEAAAVSKNFNGTQLAYKTANGSFILIDRNQPLPETVKADAGAKVSGAANASAAASDTSNSKVAGEQKSLEYATGHKLIIVFKAFVALAPSYETTGTVWISTALGGDTQFADAASAVAASQAAAGAGGAEIVVSNQ
jgi:hypothetical protein